MVIARQTSTKAAPKSSGHFYFEDGSPCFKVPNLSKAGQVRNTTVTDARKLKLYPSVTTIISLLKSIQLNYWSEGIVLDMCYDNPRNHEDDYSRDDYHDFIRRLVIEEKAKAPDEGSAIHKSIELGLVKFNLSDPYIEQVRGVKEWIEWNGITIKELEAELIPRRCGFGGTVDFIGEKDDVPYIIDFKTKMTKGKTIRQYSTQQLQLAGYKYGLGYKKARLFNLYVSRDEPGFVKPIEVPETKHDSLIERFLLLKKYYQLANELTHLN